MRTNTGLPDVVPVLSRGKHRNPRKGACFMEFASFLAGERWSDHPRCTHALLADLARQVNDNLTDEGRHRIVTLLPDVVGLTSDDPQLDVVIALRAAELAVPAAPFGRQRPLAVALLRCEQELTNMPMPSQPAAWRAAQPHCEPRRTPLSGRSGSPTGREAASARALAAPRRTSCTLPLRASCNSVSVSMTGCASCSSR
ncbi:MAG: hypothetical protein WKF73_20525 [Nocardioidaceae bacterium]